MPLPVTSALLLALWVVLQGITSFYALVLTATALLTGWLVRPGDWLRNRARTVLPLIALAVAVALVLLLPFLLPYRQLGQVRPLDEVALYSAAWRDYLATPARLHYGLWSARWFGGTTALFPGVTALALAAAAVASGRAIADRRARMALAFGIVGLALSFGPAMPGYTLLYRALPPLQGIRNAARFGYLVTVACAILAGFAVASARRRWPAKRWPRAVTLACFVAANADACSAPIDLVDAEQVSPLHARLKNTTAIVAEFPLYPPDRIARNAPYMLHATQHWRPMVNGYSGLTPTTYVEHARALARFPDAQAIALLRTLGVTHVFVHDRALRDWTDNETADAVPRSPDLTRVGQDGDLSLYELRQP